MVNAILSLVAFGVFITIIIYAVIQITKGNGGCDCDCDCENCPFPHCSEEEITRRISYKNENNKEKDNDL